MIERKYQNHFQSVELKVLYGFLTKRINLDFNIEGKEASKPKISFGSPYIPNYNNNNAGYTSKGLSILELKKLCINETQISLKKNSYWKYTLNYEYESDKYIDIFAKFKYQELAIVLAFKSIDNMDSIIKYCKKRKVEVLVINYYSNFFSIERTVNTIDYHPKSFFLGTKGKTRCFSEVLSDLLEKEYEIPF